MTLEGAKKALKQKPAAEGGVQRDAELMERCLLYTSPSPRDRTRYRMPSSA